MEFAYLEYLDDLAKLALATLAGGAIGFEREAHGQAAGLRTNILVCIGACLMMQLSLHMEVLFHSVGVTDSVVRLDPGRIASYAIASMGFLGAGAIIKGKGSVRGLTTAAGLWLVTGVGLSIGAGYIIPAVFTTCFSLFYLYSLRRIKTVLPRTEFIILTIVCSGTTSPLERIKTILLEYAHLTIHFASYVKDLKNEKIIVRIRISHREPIRFDEVVAKLSDIESVDEIKWEESEVP
ncbi:MAG TPA: MgtC/SapB family protein [Dissulfurispiraceae bacterium]|nr:MgtC/SapB family protein [Dissulfurispiraceae bacterium]